MWISGESASRCCRGPARKVSRFIPKTLWSMTLQTVFLIRAKTSDWICCRTRRKEMTRGSVHFSTARSMPATPTSMKAIRAETIGRIPRAVPTTAKLTAQRTMKPPWMAVFPTPKTSTATAKSIWGIHTLNMKSPSTVFFMIALEFCGKTS